MLALPPTGAMFVMFVIVVHRVEGKRHRAWPTTQMALFEFRPM